MREKRKPNGKANKIVAISKQSDYDAIEDDVSPKALEWFHKPIYHLEYQRERGRYGEEILLDKTKDRLF